MRQLLHSIWPLMAVIAFTAALALQIPRKALFFRPVEPTPALPYASFVEFDQAAYAKVMQQVRMSWQMRSQGGGARAEIPLAVLDRVDEPLPPAPLPLSPSFFTERTKSAPRFDGTRTSLTPPTLAAPRGMPVSAPSDDVEDRRRLRESLLALPPSLQGFE